MNEYQGIEVLQVKKDNFLLREGEKSNEMYIVKSGKFSIIKKKVGSEREIETVGERQIIGEMSFIDNSSRSASVKALADSEVYVIPREKYVQIFKGFPRWYVALFETIIRRLRNANCRINI